MKSLCSSCPKPPVRWFAATLLFLAAPMATVALAPRVARAQSEEAIAKVKELNQKALAAYENLDLDDARKALTEALQICAQEGMNEHPWKARTHVHLGAILVGGFQQKDLALKQFQRAVEIQPEITLTPALRNPETQAVFDEARKGGAAATAAPAATPAPAPAGSAPDVRGIYHKPVANAPVGSKVEVRARVGKDVKFKRLVLAYRPEGTTGFLARDMDAEADGWYAARIPEPATQGGLVQYYIEARDEAGRPVASNGSEAEPHVVALGDAALAGLDDASLVESEEDGSEGASKPSSAAQDKTGFVFGLGIGTGYGFVSGVPEVNGPSANLDFSGVAPSKAGHLNIEVGYALRPGFIASLQVRAQRVSGATVAFALPDDNQPTGVKYSPATGALAVFAKGTWLLGQPGTFRPYVSAMLGAGEVRHVVDISDKRSDCGPLPKGFMAADPSTYPNEGCIDTVNSGPAFVGGGAGLLIKAADSFGITLGLNAIAGLPRFMLHADLNVGALLLF